MAERRLLLAGSFGPERLPVLRDRDDADWFKPLHVRDAAGARGRIADQVAAGADVVIAPTWLTHRRALLPLGETRRAADWSAAAVRLARDGVEVGLERRDAALGGVVDDHIRPDRPAPLVVATLPALDSGSEQEHGRLHPRDAATQRDYRDQAGILADAAPDLLLVEGQREESEAQVAMTEAIDTGLPVWAALEPRSLATVGLDEWLDRTRGLGIERLLAPPPLEERTALIDGDLAWGGVGVTAKAIEAWLEAGAGVVARLDGATASSLEPLRAAIDEYEAVALMAARARDQRWADLVARAAAMAPGGAAVWIGPPGEAALPVGFDWLVVDAGEARRLPPQRYRLVVATASVSGFGHLLERGGVLVGPSDRAGVPAAELRSLAIDDTTEPPLVTLRRED